MGLDHLLPLLFHRCKAVLSVDLRKGGEQKSRAGDNAIKMFIHGEVSDEVDSG